MILKALSEYYRRKTDLPKFGRELVEIAFIIVIDKNGNFLRFEDRRINKSSAQNFVVTKRIPNRSGTGVKEANYLYDDCKYVLGYSPNKEQSGSNGYLNSFKQKVEQIKNRINNDSINAVYKFYQTDIAEIHKQIQSDQLWDEIQRNLNKKFSMFSFLIEGDTKIIAEHEELLDLLPNKCDNKGTCMVTGENGNIISISTPTMIPGSQATAKLVSFQTSSGYDSYGKTQGENAPICEQTDFAYTTALKHMLSSDSRNKFLIGNQTLLFWTSLNDIAGKQIEEGIFELFGLENNEDNPDVGIDKIRKVFYSIYSGELQTTLNDKFFILGLIPNSARIAVTTWSEIQLTDFAKSILSHFEDMEIVDSRKEKKPYVGLYSMVKAIALNATPKEVPHNLISAIVKSIFEGLPYPETLYNNCIRRIRAEQKINITRAAILKAYLNRKNNRQKIKIMLDKENKNQGYLCGRLFGVLVKVQNDAYNKQSSSIRDRYMNAASSTPSTVFATILNLSTCHAEKLSEGSRIYYEKIKQEIIDKLDADGFPTHLNLQDQGRFFVGYYQQLQSFYTKNEENISE